MDVLKNKTIGDDLPSLLRKAHYKNAVLKNSELLDELIANNSKDDISNAERINNAYYARLKRYKKHVSYLIDNFCCLFFTLTFDNKSLTNLNQKSRRVYITRYLKSVSSWYIANVDFGSKNEREHYHGILAFVNESEMNAFLKKCKFSKFRKGYELSWTCGFALYQKCGSSKDDITRLSKYIVKLTNHAFKDTAKNSKFHCIYSKGFETRNLLLETLNHGVEAFGCLKFRSFVVSDLVKKGTHHDLVYFLMRKYQYTWVDNSRLDFRPCRSNEIQVDNGLILSDDLPF